MQLCEHITFELPDYLWGPFLNTASPYPGIIISTHINDHKKKCWVGPQIRVGRRWETRFFLYGALYSARSLDEVMIPSLTHMMVWR